ncbi:MAG: hypothetical protein ACKOAC_09210, partial [Fluviibacter sp.]
KFTCKVITILSSIQGQLRSAYNTMATANKINVATAGVFIVYEFLKLALTLILLAVAIVLYADLSWPSMLLSMAITLQVNFLALAKRT